MYCPYCEGEINPSAQKCRHCGEWLQAAPPPPPPPRPAPAPAPPAPVYVHQPPPQVHVSVGQAPPESVAFAVVTLVMYFLIYPVALIMNIIGLFTGPRRGCFLSMFLVFLIPVAILVFILLTGAATGIEEFDEAVREWRYENNMR